MFILTRNQMARLADHARQQFVDKACRLLARRQPVVCAQLGAADLRHVVQRGFDKATQARFENEDDVLDLLETFVLHGLDFDEDPQRPWLGESLSVVDNPPRLRLRQLQWLIAHPPAPPPPSHD